MGEKKMKDLSPPEQMYVRMAELWCKIGDRLRDLEKVTMDRVIDAMIQKGHEVIDHDLPLSPPADTDENCHPEH